MLRPLLIFILSSCAVQNLIAQCVLSIQEIGTKSNLLDSIIVANYWDIKPVRINDSTVEFTCNIVEPEDFFIILDYRARWDTLVWMDPKIKRRELIIDYFKKTAALKNPTEWDITLKKLGLLEEQNMIDKADSIALSYVEQHPDSFASLWLFTHSSFNETLTQNQRLVLFNKLNPALEKYPEYKQAKNSLKERKYPVLGDSFKEFSLKDINDSIFSSVAVKNKWIFLHFWATFCSPCVREMDGLVSFYNTLDTSKISFVSVALDDDRTKWKNSKTTHKIKWANIWQTDNFYGELCLNYNVDMVPFFIIFNKEKKIHLITFGEELELIKNTLSSVQ